MPEVGDAYGGCRRRVGELVGALTEEQAAAKVPACPSWTVHDVCAHLAGVVDDAINGRLDGVATEPWTDAQVEARRGVPLAEILAEWDEKAPVFEGLLDAVGMRGRQAVTDAVSHEHDLRGALGAPGARQSDAVGIAYGFLVPALVDSASVKGLSLRVEDPEGDGAGDDDARIVLSGNRFELVRAMTGRKSAAQVR
ncbi:MAG TPA: maleylpyruvate isomerase family mycothiol-dependent enzyme, partial [Acidimicrobiales bacterium]|nr:maleylpyruvate isomerase family mycothiol-dependent enzyme [Acidimicrobiales bacterium]